MGDGRGLHDRAALFAPRSRGTAHNKVHGVNDSGGGRGGEEGGGGGFADPPLEERAPAWKREAAVLKKRGRVRTAVFRRTPRR